MQTNNTDWKMILELGMEGGTLAIYRSTLQDGEQKFALIRDEGPQEENVEEEVDWGLLFEEYPPRDTFEDAVRDMDSYPWREMLLLRVHPDYETYILDQMKLPRLPGPRR